MITTTKIYDEEHADFFLQIMDFLDKLPDESLVTEAIARIRIQTQLAILDKKLAKDNDPTTLFATVPNDEFPAPWTKTYSVTDDAWSVVSGGNLEVGFSLPSTVAHYLVARANNLGLGEKPQ